MPATVPATPALHGTPQVVEVAIVGAGFGGLCMAIQLLERGERNFVVLEQADDVGGTWRDNHYPGAECDVQSHLYSYSFAGKADWSQRYAGWDEIQQYILDVAARYGLRPYVRFRQRVTGLHFDAPTARWRVMTATGLELAARHVVLATGPLHVPHIPNIAGLERFQGRVFHSARWDGTYGFAGKRVASIGTGGSAIQYCPRIAPQVERLHVFQRTPAWVIPRDTRRYGVGARRRFARFDTWRKLHRARLYWTNESRVWPIFHPALARALQRVAAWNIRREVGDTDLARRLTPDYTIGCKRVLISNEWYPMFRRSNVELVTEGIREITTTGVVTSDGVERPVDCIVLGTGFVVDPRIYMRDFAVAGLPGHELSRDWRAGAEAFYGISVSGYPNLHQLVGPNTALGHNSIIFMIEAQVHYVLECMRMLRERGADWLTVEPRAQTEFNARVQAGLRNTVWSTGCRSWYQQDDGRNFTIWPWSTWRYWLETRRVDASKYRFGKAAAAAVLAASLAMTACSAPETPEQQVRAVVAAAEDAAERRDHSDLMALVSPEFEGARGEDAREVSRMLRGYLVAHPSIHVATRIDEVDFPYDDMARVRLTVGTLGSDARALEVSADTRAVALELQRRDGEWRVTRAEWD
ncbi:MAG TPA: NAD(P)/FAD-dependent oxidoreductase [Steroidobacteraceae bacterium]|nr:NAD(P)/FAD-dependent oxidoreductase [Steroidobacteraceae bacterium]